MDYTNEGGEIVIESALVAFKETIEKMKDIRSVMPSFYDKVKLSENGEPIDINEPISKKGNTDLSEQKTTEKNEPNESSDEAEETGITSNENQEISVNLELQDLTEEQKQTLRDNGMSESNIEKCKVDKDGVVYLKTYNDKFEGQEHPPGSGVYYYRKEIEINGVKIVGVFPKFNSVYECNLSPENLKATDKEQFKEATKQLAEEIKKNPELKKQFNERQLEQIMNGEEKISGYTWHHNEELGKMELVKTEEHQKSSHTGGQSIWGGGQENRK